MAPDRLLKLLKN